MSLSELKVEHQAGRGIRNCPIFWKLPPSLDEAYHSFGETDELVVAPHPKYCAADNTAMGWSNANLRTKMQRPLRCEGTWGCSDGPTLRINQQPGKKRCQDSIR